LNAFAERWVRSVKEECLSKLILFGEGSLRRALTEFVEHYHSERNHQGKGNVLLFPTKPQPFDSEGSVDCRQRLGAVKALRPRRMNISTTRDRHFRLLRFSGLLIAGAMLTSVLCAQFGTENVADPDIGWPPQVPFIAYVGMVAPGKMAPTRLLTRHNL